jgi:hypothetical protein
VGGSSAHFNANFWRLHEIDFIEGSRWGPVEGASLVDWPITYAELEPYYTKVEWEVGVSGLAGPARSIPWRSKPYPMPPLPVKSSGVLFERGARKLGLHPFPAPMAINSREYKGRPPCAQCGLCGGYGCEVMAKSSSVWTVIPEAEATSRCECVRKAMCSAWAWTRPGAPPASTISTTNAWSISRRRARWCFRPTGRKRQAAAQFGHRRFEHGLANSSGVVGRYLMFNKGGGAMARLNIRSTNTRAPMSRA